MTMYRTSDGDVLDVICLRFYGSASGYLEMVLAANPGLAERGPKLPADILITLPDIPSLPSAKRTIRLWD